MVKYLFVWVQLFVCLFGFGQHYNFINYSTEDGLAASQIRGITQDLHGYLWIGTFGGLSRFDGIEFKNYSERDGLISNRCRVVFASNKGEIFVGSRGGISVVSGDSIVRHRIPKHGVRSIIDWENEKYVVGTKEGELYWFEPSSEKPITPIKFEGELRDVQSLLRLGEGVLIGTDRGVYRLDMKTNTLRHVYTSVKTHAASLAQDSDGNVWIANYGKGMWQGSPSGQLLNYFNFKESSYKISFRSIMVDKQSNVWAALKSGLIRYSEGGFTTFNRTNGLQNDNLFVVFQDRQDNIWIGTDGGGLYKFSGDAFTTFSMKDGLADDAIMSISEANDGIWFSTYGNGVSKLDTVGKVFNYTTNEGLLNNTVWSSTILGSDIIFGTSGGLSIKSLDHGFTSISDGLSAKKVVCVKNINDTVWIGTQSGFDLLLNGEIIPLSRQLDRKTGSVRDFELDKNTGDVLVSADKSVLRLRVEEGNFKVIKRYVHKDISRIQGICFDPRGNLWVGASDGLYLLDSTLHRVDFSKKFSSQPVNFCAVDKFQDLWLGTDRGVFVLSLDSYYGEGLVSYNHYARMEGLPSLETNQNAITVDVHGDVWFGTTGGVTKVNSKLRKEITNRVPPAVKIKQVKLFLEETDWLGFGAKIDSVTGLPVDLELPYRQNSVSFFYRAITHYKPQEVRYQFRLSSDGLLADWSPDLQTHFASFPNTRYGSHFFEVRASYDGINWGEATPYSFVVKPPYWLTTWFVLMCTLLAVLALIVLYRYRRAVRIRKESTQKLVYKTKLAALEQQTLNASLNRHFIFNALNSIQYYINREDKLQANRYLSSFAKLIRKNLDSSTSESGLVSLSEEIERLELYLYLEHMRFTQKFDYAINVGPEVGRDFIEVPPMFLQPYVENSIWHGLLPMESSGRIDVNITVYQSVFVRFEIVDNGIGINVSMKRKKLSSNKHDSKGVALTKSRISLLQKVTSKRIEINGPTQIEDAEGNVLGTKVEILLPLDVEPTR